MARSTVTPEGNQATKRPRFKAPFTKQQVEEIEAKHNTTWGMRRRVLMATMSLSSKEMIDGFSPLLSEDNGDAYIEMFQMIKDYRQHLQDSVELADAAMARLLLVGKYLSDQADDKQH